MLARAMQSVGLYQLSRDKFYFDPIYNLFVVWPLQGIANLAAWFDRNLIDGLVDFAARFRGGWAPAAAAPGRHAPVLRPGDGAGPVGVDRVC